MPPTAPDLIQFVPPSDWAVCLHEAGHAAAAIVVGSVPASMEIIDGPPPYGRNRILRVSGAPRRCIAVGGYVVELTLFQANRLINADGQPIAEADFIAQAVGHNAALDKIAYFEADRQDANGMWPACDDRAFMKFGAQLQPIFPIDKVFSLAAALIEERQLSSERIVEIWKAVKDADASVPAHTAADDFPPA